MMASRRRYGRVVERDRASSVGVGERAGGRVVVVGRAARDLVLRAPRMPESGGSASVEERVERLGGKGANTAIGIRQLDPETTPVLIAALGADAAGDAALREASEAGLDVSHVARRGRTALLVDLVADGGERRLLEDVPEEALVTTTDVALAADALRGADIVVLQLQEPPEALVAAARLGHEGGARIVLDGAIEGPAREVLLGLAAVVRADGHEAQLLTGIEIADRGDADRAAIALLERGVALVALSVPGEGDLVAWHGGSRLYPHGAAEVVDPTGAGDAFVAGLVTGMRRGDERAALGQLAAQAAAATVERLGGHPELAHLRPLARPARPGRHVAGDQRAAE